MIRAWQEPEIHRPRNRFNDFGRAFYTPGIGMGAKAAGVGLSTAATLGIAGGVFAAEQLLKHVIGQGRRAANKWVQGSGGQNAFLKNVLAPASTLAQQDPVKARAFVEAAWKEYLGAADEYASKGNKQAQAIRQNLMTPAFMQTVGNLLGRDPLDDTFTNDFMGAGKIGSILSKVGGAVKGGLGAILSTIKPPKPAAQPGATSGSIDPETGEPVQTAGGVGGTGAPPAGGDEGGPGWGQLLGKMGAQIGAGIGTSVLGSKLSQAKPTDMENQVLQSNLEAQKLGMGTGQNLLAMGTQALQPALQYQSSILSGNRGQVTSAMAPEISRIGEGYRAAANTSAALNPRGGPGTAFMSELPFQQQRDVSSLLQKARPAAAQSMMGAGTDLIGRGVTSIFGSTGAGRDILTTQARMRQIEQERGGKVGAGLFDTFTKYGMPALEKAWPKVFGGG